MIEDGSFSPRRILIFCQDIPPSWGHPTAGGGVRCWGLTKGLESRGHRVLVSVPRPNVVNVSGAPAEALELSHHPGELLPVVRDVDPDVVLTVQWPLAAMLDGLSVPLAIDLYGPLLLESLYFSSVHWESLVARKMRALYLGDFYLCGSQRQLAYFLPWLLQAGVQLDSSPVHVAPLTMPPPSSAPVRCPSGEPHFVAAGIFWPWQNPSAALLALLDALDEVGMGKLTIVGGPHPQWKQGFFPGRAPEWPEELLSHPRVIRRDLMPWEELADLLSTAHFGVDLSLPNVERFLAAPTRVYHYLWSGLPVLLSNYLELAPVVIAAGAGWAVDPTDGIQVRDAVHRAIRMLENWETMSGNTSGLVSDWESEPQPLYDFCNNPRGRERSPSLEQRLVGELVKVYKGLGNAEAELEHLHKDVRDRDTWLLEANERCQGAEARLRGALEDIGVLSDRLVGAQERLAKVRNSVPYRIYRAMQVLISGPDEVQQRTGDRRKRRRSFASWFLLLRLTAVGMHQLLIQGVRKWKSVMAQRVKARASTS